MTTDGRLAALQAARFAIITGLGYLCGSFVYHEGDGELMIL